MWENIIERDEFFIFFSHVSIWEIVHITLQQLNYVMTYLLSCNNYDKVFNFYLEPNGYLIYQLINKIFLSSQHSKKVNGREMT